MEHPKFKIIDYRNLNFQEIGEGWIKYEGYFDLDKKHGTGNLYFANGDYFKGTFV